MKPTFTAYLFWLLLLLGSIQSYGFVDASLQMQLGNPSNATADTNNHSHFLIERTVEALDYNDNLGQPNWAAWDLTASDVGTNSRSTFVTDTNLPSNFTRYATSIYNNAGWDRGHLCPSKDRTDTSTNNDLVFFMSNVLPQSGVNNSGVWLQFENYCRDQVQSTNNYELLLICGGSGYGSARLTNGPFIPDYTWKIAVIVPPGSGMATNRITATNRVIAVKIPNNDSATNTWPTYVTSVNQIQVDTGLTFFTGLAPDVATALRAKVDGQTNPPPSIFAFSPSTGATGTNVIITGTNFTGATAVAFNGVNASFTINNSNQITATVPTNAQTGSISVTSSSGTAISSNTFTVTGSVFTFTGVLAGWDVKGVTNYGPSPYPATTSAANLVVVGLTRSANMRTNNAGAQDGWGGVAFTNQSAASAIASNVFVTFSLTASNGYKVSYTSINRFDYRRSNTGPTNSLLQFSVGNASFVDVMTFSNTAAANGATNAPIDLSGYAALQNVGENTNVTFRIVNYNGTSTGVWYVWDVLGNTQPDLSVSGTVTQVLTTNAPAIPATFSSFVFTNNQFRFTVTGTAGSNYVVQATTNLTSPNWIPIYTNIAPFVFTQINTPAFSQRFYRSFAQ